MPALGPGSSGITLIRTSAEDIFDDFNLTFVNNGNDVKIEGEMLNPPSWWNDPLQVRFNVVVPQDYGSILHYVLRQPAA